MSTPFIGRRDLTGPNDFGVKYDVVIAEKQKMMAPGGKREKVIVFSRVPQSRLEEDTTGKTQRAAKRAVNLLRERLQKSGLSKDKVETLMQNMFAVDQRGFKNNEMKTMSNALDAKALDVLLEKKAMKSGKVRFSEEDQAMPTPDARQASASTSAPTTIDLPPLPDLPDMPDLPQLPDLPNPPSTR